MEINALLAQQQDLGVNGQWSLRSASMVQDLSATDCFAQPKQTRGRPRCLGDLFHLSVTGNVEGCKRETLETISGFYIISQSQGPRTEQSSSTPHDLWPSQLW